MIGTLRLGPRRTASLAEAGAWVCSPPDAAMEDYLNDTHDPDDAHPGDHHRPFGVAAVERAATALGVTFELMVEPYGELPTGAVS
jgi:hypothetical protein